MKVNLFELYDTASCLEEQGLKPQSPDHGLQSRGLRPAQALSCQLRYGSETCLFHRPLVDSLEVEPGDTAIGDYSENDTIYYEGRNEEVSK